jgi:hypothetical protein
LEKIEEIKKLNMKQGGDFTKAFEEALKKHYNCRFVCDWKSIRALVKNDTIYNTFFKQNKQWQKVLKIFDKVAKNTNTMIFSEEDISLEEHKEDSNVYHEICIMTNDFCIVIIGKDNEILLSYTKEKNAKPNLKEINEQNVKEMFEKLAKN